MPPRLEWDADTDSAQRAARVVALIALDAVVETRGQLRQHDASSLHEFRIAITRLRSWMRRYQPSLQDTLEKKTRRRLRRIARATTELRDLDVQIKWLREERHALGDTRLEAARWILLSLKADRKRAWRKFRRVLRDEFAKAVRSLRRELRCYVVTRDVRLPETAAGIRAITAKNLHNAAKALDAAFERVRSADDTRRLHRVRIIAKRTRYVLEALATQAPDLFAAADDLHRFQDAVGELRDAQLLAHRVTLEITSVAAKRTALVAREMVYRPAARPNFSRVVADSPFDASLSLLFARLRDRISAASRVVTAALEPSGVRRLVAGVESASATFARPARGRERSFS